MKNKCMVLLLLLAILSSCSRKVYDNTLPDQRKKHTQRVVQKDITKTRVFIFVCVGLGLWIGANVTKDGGGS